MKKLMLILLLLVLVSCEKEFKTLQRSYVISNFIELNNDLDTKLYIICSKYDALHLYKDVKGTIIQEIGIQNYSAFYIFI